MGRGLLGVGPALFAILTACGGGGGGGGGGSSSGGSNGSNGSSGSLNYSGNTSPAVVTGTNAARLVSGVLGDGQTSAAFTAGAVTPGGSSAGLAELARNLNQGLRVTGRSGSSGPVPRASIPIDTTVPCDSGTLHEAGTLNDNATGTLAVTYNDCRTGTQTVSGSATLRLDAFDLLRRIPTDYTITFPRLTLRGSAGSQDLSGSLRTQTNVGANTETITINLVSLDNATGIMAKAEDFVLVDVFDNVISPSNMAETLSGRIFDAAHGYVNISTNAPFFSASISQSFPSTGQVQLTGAGNAHIRVSAISSQMAMVDLDLNGDNAFETSARLQWTDFSRPVGADLADSDGDGMHNSWETAYGLDPHNPTDAALDKDNDGASNKDEYLAGTDPSNRNSFPPPVGLSVSSIDAPDPAAVNMQVTYTITVYNSSASSALNVVMSDTLPAGANFVSVATSQGSCPQMSPLTCNLGTLTGFNSAVISIVVTPTVQGVLNNTARVTTSSFDPDLSNNTATSTTTVGQAASGLQGLIDAATPGSTITVVPGTYVGGLNFNGKNVTLQSRDGPATTIIDGRGSVSGIQIGPGGAIKGFTITGSGVQASGNGSLISGNIFDNVVSAGTFGTAIGGNGASPIIERNVFRNHVCGISFFQGVIVFANNSSPQIVNNVFENNQCTAIDLVLPEGNTPQIINNDFVGNRTAIHVDRRVPQGTQAYRNNLFVQNGTVLELEFGMDAGNPVWENNLVFGNATDYLGTSNQTGSHGNLSADPLFVDVSTLNYRLRAGSPAIDAGSAAGAPAVDFDGAPRPRGAGVDIGAFEAQ